MHLICTYFKGDTNIKVERICEYCKESFIAKTTRLKVTIPEEKQDRKLASKIIASELPCIFNFSLDGLTRLLKNKAFIESDVVKNKINQYKTESDSVLMFLRDEGYVTSFATFNPLEDLYHLYKFYYEDNHYRTCSLRTFAQRLRNNNFIVESEKTAIIGHLALPEFIWLACGSAYNLNERVTKVL